MPDRLLGGVAETMAAAQSLEALTRPLLALLERATGLETTYLTRVDVGAGVQRVLIARNSGAMQIGEGLALSWEDTLCRRAIAGDQPFTADVAACWADSPAAQTFGIRTFLSMPVYLGNGALFGTLCAAGGALTPITHDARQALSLFATLIERQIEREDLREKVTELAGQLEAQALTDPLTGLANRRCLLEEGGRLFELAQRAGRAVLVAFIDLDGFKVVNDTWGHDAGDTFLIEMGRRLAQGLRVSDLLGRLGGDEFVVIGLGPLPGEETAAIAAMESRLTPQARGHFQLGVWGFDYAGASIGVIAVDPRLTTPDQALRQADAAMAREKKARQDWTVASS